MPQNTESSAHHVQSLHIMYKVVLLSLVSAGFEISGKAFITSFINLLSYCVPTLFYLKYKKSFCFI